MCSTWSLESESALPEHLGEFCTKACLRFRLTMNINVKPVSLCHDQVDGCSVLQKLRTEGCAGDVNVPFSAQEMTCWLESSDVDSFTAADLVAALRVWFSASSSCFDWDVRLQGCRGPPSVGHGSTINRGRVVRVRL